MAQLSDADVAAVVLGAGFTGDAAVKAVAIALGESGGNTEARGDINITTTTWGPSIGLFQIRSLNAQRGTGGQRDEIANLDRNTNARNAFAISASGTNFRAWSVFTSGRYLGYLPRASRAVGAPGTVGGSGVIPASSSSSSGFSILTDPGTYARLGVFILGGFFTGFALFRVTGAGPKIKAAARTAVSVVAKVPVK